MGKERTEGGRAASFKHERVDRQCDEGVTKSTRKGCVGVVRGLKEEACLKQKASQRSKSDSMSKRR